MKKSIKNIMATALLAGVFIVNSCTKEPEPDDYKYEVTGTSNSFSVTIVNTDDNVQQYNPVGSGWWYKWTQTGTRYLYVSAQNNNSSGSVTVKIYKNNVVVSENTSTGGYTIATTSGNY